MFIIKKAAIKGSLFVLKMGGLTLICFDNVQG